MPYHLYSSVLFYLIPTASMSAVGPSCLSQPVLTDRKSLFPTYLHHSVISDWYSPDNPTGCSSLIPEQPVGDNSLIQLWYDTCIRPEGATGCNAGLLRFCVCTCLVSDYPVLRSQQTGLAHWFSANWMRNEESVVLTKHLIAIAIGFEFKFKEYV